MTLPALRKDETAWTGSGGSGGRRVGASRALGLSRYEWTAVHRPTGLYVTGLVPDGHYTRGEMTALKDELWQLVWRELAFAVAKETRQPRQAIHKVAPHPPFHVTIGRYTANQLAKRGMAWPRKPK